MKTFKISEIKEQGIWVKCTGADALRLLLTFDEYKYSSLTAAGRNNGFYSWSNKRNDYDCTDEAPITYIEFIQIDWEERKQIGWKVKKECEQYRTAAMKICNDMPFLENYRWNIHTNSVNANTLQSAGVLELWFEPVYEEVKFKIGDWVKVVNTEGMCSGEIGHVFQLTSDGSDGWYRGKTKGGGFQIHNVVKATAEEIKAAEKIEIGGYEVICGEGFITISGFQFNKADLEAALRVSLHPKMKIKIGCSYQFDLPTETIERILSKLK